MTPDELCSLLHYQHQQLRDDSEMYKWWYDHVYTPIVDLLVQKFPKMDTVRFSWCVATGKDWRES